MKFKYEYLRDHSAPNGQSRKFIKVPFINVRLAYGDKYTDIVGLVDTGATDCLFDQDVAEDLGIDAKSSSIERIYTGVGGQSVTGYVHRVGLRILKSSEWLEIDAAFMEVKQPFQLLGQAGFFDNYEITFKRYRGQFEIKSRSQLR